METNEKTTEQIAEYFMQKYGKLATDVAQELLENAMQNFKLSKELNLGSRAEGLASGDIKCWKKTLDFIRFNQEQTGIYFYNKQFKITKNERSNPPKKG